MRDNARKKRRKRERKRGRENEAYSDIDRRIELERNLS
jgi:hypothetical protein